MSIRIKLLGQFRKTAKSIWKWYREKQLKPGERGLGIPRAPITFLPGIGRNKKYKVAIIGCGAQGIAHILGYRSLSGIELVGISEINHEKLKGASLKFGLPDDTLFSSTEAMLDKLCGKVDMISISTTSSSHIKLSKLCLQAGVRKIIIEKPLDISLEYSINFNEIIKMESNSSVAVNYSRRWSIDYQAILRAINKGIIGKVKSISIMVGKGELAMIASHYFDLCNMFMQDTPSGVSSTLESLKEVNRRGEGYNDPYGFTFISYQNGGRAYLDFSSDLGSKTSQIIVRGDQGHIFIDEYNMIWEIQSDRQYKWSIPFIEPIRSQTMFARVAAQVLIEDKPKCTVQDALYSMYVIYGSHLSSRNGSGLIRIPFKPDSGDGLNLSYP